MLSHVATPPTPCGKDNLYDGNNTMRTIHIEVYDIKKSHSLSIPACGKLIRVFLDTQERIVIFPYLEIKTVVVIHARLPHAAGLIMLFCAQGRMAEIAEQMCYLLHEYAPDIWRQFPDLTLKVRRVFKAHVIAAWKQCLPVATS